ncbi:MAG: ABC transporter substrate-binding protein, partial [Candidatus Acetothermia bacterium]
EEIRVVDEMTFAFELSEPFPTMLNHLSNPTTGLVSPTAVEEYGEDYGKQAVVGTGPVKFENWESAEEIVLTRYEDYNWGPSYLENQGPAYPEEWIFRIVPETLTLVGELEKGGVDLTTYIPEKEKERLEEAEGVSVASLKAPSTAYVAINVQNPPFDEVEVRKAIAHAINKEAVIKAALAGNAFPAHSMIPSNVEGYWEDGEELAKEATGYDPEKAKNLLAEAGWEDVDGDRVLERDGEELEATTFAFTITRYKRMAEVVKPMLEEVGIKVDLKILEAGDLYERSEGGEHDLQVTAWMGVTYAQDFLAPLYNSKNVGSSNYSFFESEKMDDLLKEGKTALSKEERTEALNEAQRLLLERMPSVPLAHYIDMLGHKDTIVGVDAFVQHSWALTGGVDLTKPLIFRKQ